MRKNMWISPSLTILWLWTWERFKTASQHVSRSSLFESNTSPIVAEPLFDIRHINDSSEPREHLCTTLNNALLVQRDDKYILIRIRTLDSDRCEVRTWNRELEWFYKLGSGFRANYDGRTVFIGEKKKLVSLGEIVLHANSPMLIISCINSCAKLDWLHEDGLLSAVPWCLRIHALWKYAISGFSALVNYRQHLYVSHSHTCLHKPSFYLFRTQLYVVSNLIARFHYHMNESWTFMLV